MTKKILEFLVDNSVYLIFSCLSVCVYFSKKKRDLKIIYLFVFLFTAQVSHALTTAAQEGQPYKFNPTEKDRPGVCVEIMNALEKKNPKLKFIGKDNAVPLKRIESMLVNGDLDVFFGLIKNKERAAVVNFPENGMIFELNSRVAVSVDEKENPKDLNELMQISKSSRILVSMNTAFEKVLENKGINFDNGGKYDPSNLKKILEKRGRFFFTGDSNLANHLRKPEFKNKFKVLDATYSKEEMYAAFSNKISKDQVKLVTDGIKKLRDNKVIDEILKKY